MDGLVFLVTALVTGLLLARARARRGARRQAAYERGEAVTLPVRLAVDAPATSGSYAPGWVATGDGLPVWRPRRAGMTPVPLGGARVLRTDAPTGLRHAGEFVVTAQLPDGTLLRLGTGFPYLELLQRILDTTPSVPAPDSAYAAPAAAPPRYVPPRPPGPVPWWSAALLGLTAGWALVWAWFWVAGTVLDAWVVSNPEGMGCEVTWTAGGQEHRADVACVNSERPGDRIRVLTFPGRFAGTATDTHTATLFPLLVGGLGLVVGVAGIALRARQRRRPGARPRGHVLAADVPVLGEDEVVWSRISEVMAARAAAEGWAGAGDAAGPSDLSDDGAPRRWWHAAGLRRLARRSALRLILPAVLLGAAASAGWASWVTTARLAGGDTAVAHAVVMRTSDDHVLPLLPTRALVHYRVEGRAYDVWLPVRRDLTRGQDISILYATAAPARARLDEDGDGLPRQAATTGILAGLAAALMARRVVRTLGDVAALARARRGPAKDWRYVRFVDHTGRPGVMLFSRFSDAGPAAVVPLLADEPGPGAGVPVSGEAPVHGDVTAGGLVVPVLGGRTYWPVGRATELPADVVRHLVNGTLPGPGLARLTSGGRPAAR